MLTTREKVWITYLGFILWSLSAIPPFLAQTQVKPGMNFFSVEQDVQLGREASQEAERQLNLIEDPEGVRYLNQLGKRIARNSVNPELPYQFKLVNSKDINAFAFPGGYIYVNRGLIDAADNESELAGVLGHEISHAALRHGTNQLSKQLLITAPLTIIGSFLGQSGGWKQQLASLGISLGLNGVLLKFSRDAERQADLAGVQAIHGAGIEPDGMMTFFKKLEDLRGRDPSRLESFFSSHPSPEDRVRKVGEEVVKLPILKKPQRDSAEFQSLKSRLKTLAAPNASRSRYQDQADTETSIPEPSTRFTGFQHRRGLYAFEFPDNWRVIGESGSGVTIVPPGGARSYRNQSQIVYGVMVNVFDVAGRRRQTLETATTDFLDELQHGNPHLQLVPGSQSRFTLAGSRAVGTLLKGQAPGAGHTEAVWVITRVHPNGLFSFVFVSPEQDFRAAKPVFERIVRTARFPR